MKYEWNYSSTALINRTGDCVLNISYVGLAWQKGKKKTGKSYSDKTSFDENGAYLSVFEQGT